MSKDVDAELTIEKLAMMLANAKAIRAERQKAYHQAERELCEATTDLTLLEGRLDHAVRQLVRSFGDGARKE